MLRFEQCKEHSWTRAWDWLHRRWVWICENPYCDAVKPDGFYGENNEGETLDEGWIPFEKIEN